MRSLLVFAGLYWWQYTTKATAPPPKTPKKALATLAKIKNSKKAKKAIDKAIIICYGCTAGTFAGLGWHYVEQSTR